MRDIPLFPLKPAPAPLTVPRSIEGVVQTISGVPEYHWWYGCSPTAGGMIIGWWDSQPGGDRLFDGDGTVWFGDLTYGTRRMVASQAHYDAGQALGLTYGSYKDHTADCIADFFKTENGGTSRLNMAQGFMDFCAWDDPTTGTNDESYPATATTYYTSGGWTYADYCAEIDAGRPVHLGLTSTAGGHSVTGVGYDNTGGKQEYIAWTTWSGWPLVSWGWTGESQSGYNFSVYGSTYLQVQPDVAQQPDMQVRNASEPSYIGNGVYNSDGTDQTKSQSAEAGTTVTYDLKAQNDGTTADSLVTTGTAGGAGWTVAYYDALTGGTEITGQVTGAGYTTASLAQGDYEELRVEVTPDASVSDGTVKDVLVTATSVADGTKSDTVKATTSKGAYTTIIIGTGTSSMNFPMGTWYHDERTQVVYLASEIGMAGAICSLALDVETVPGQTMTNWTIRMKHTSMSSYPSPASWEGSGWTVCYQGNEPPGSTGWRTFEFTTPFPYDGTSNLLVDFSFNNTYYTTDGFCRCSTPGGNRTIYYRADSTYGDPLLWSGTTSPTPAVSTYVPNVQLTLGGGGTTTTISVFEDEWVANGSYSDSNFNSWPDLGVGWDSINSCQGRTYLKFDLSGISGGSSITQATLHVRLSWKYLAPDRDVGVYSTTDGWSETTITWNNAPAVGAGPNDTVAPPFMEDTWYTWNVTAPAVAELAGDGVLSLVLRENTETGDGTLDFWYEKENDPALAAYLEITTGDPALLPPVMDAEPATTPGTSNTVSWTDPNTPDADEYQAQCAEDDAFTTIKEETAWQTDKSYAFGGLTEGNTYWYRARCREGGETTLFEDDFEDGDWAGWTAGSGTYTREVTSATAAAGTTYSLTLTGGANSHYDGVYHSLSSLTPDDITFYVRSASTTAADGYFVVWGGAGMAVGFYCRPTGEMGLWDGTTFWGAPYSALTWYKIRLALDWGAKQVDYYVNDSLVHADVPFYNASVSSLTRVDLYNYNSSQAWWDEIEFTTGGGGGGTVSDWSNVVSSIQVSGTIPDVVINEIDPGDYDAIELYNKDSSAATLTGWTVVSKTAGGTTTTFTMPSFSLGVDSYVVLHETTGTNTTTDLYFGQNISWTHTSGGSCALKDSFGTGVDFVRWGGSTESPPSGTNWIAGSDPPNGTPPQTLGRDGSSTDTDQGSDWTWGAATLGGPNAIAAPDPPVLNAEPTYTQGTFNILYWSSATGATGYYLEWDTTDAFTSPDGNSGWFTGTLHQATGLTDGQIYYYRVKARNGGGESGWSNTEHSTQDASPPSSQVSALTDPTNQSSFTVSWTSSDATSGVGYVRLYYRHGGGGAYQQFGGNHTGTSTTFNCPDGDGLYEFYTQATDNASNEEAAPATADAQCTVDTTPPDTSAGPLNESYDTAVIDVPFTASDGGGTGVASVVLWYRHRPFGVGATWGAWTEDGSYGPGDSPVSFDTSAAEGDGCYEFYTIGTDDVGNEEDAPASADCRTVVVTSTLLPPVMDAEPAYTVGTSNEVSWTDPNDPDADEYQAQCAEDDAFTTIKEESAWQAGESYNFEGLTPGNTYWYRARARRLLCPGATSDWSQTTQAEFETDTLTDTSATSQPGDVVLAAGGSTLFEDDFEDGDWVGWTAGSGTYTREVTSATAAAGTTYSLTLIGSSSHDNGVSHDLASLTPDDMTFYVRSDSTGSSNGYFVVGTGTDNSETAVFFYTKYTGEMGIYDGLTWWGTSYSALTWYKIRVAFDWVNKQVDYYVNDSLVHSNVPFRGSAVSSLTKVYLYNYDDSQAWWDEIEFSTGSSSYVASGTVVSTAITPSPLEEWETLSYNTTTPINTTLTVDVLDASDDSVLLSDVASGTDLSEAGVAVTSIKLRANLATSDDSVTPALHDWAVSWTESADLYQNSDWSDAVQSTQDSGSAPNITGWAIAATHGATVGELICPVTEGHIDSRTCCIGCLVVSFTEALDPATVGASAIQIVGATNGDVSLLVDSATLEGDGSTMRITTSAALPDPDWYTITILATVCDPGGNPLEGDRDVKIGSLHGDANGNLTVDVGDMLAVRAKIGLDVDCSTARYDVNGNGTIDVGDMLAARARVGHSLPAGP